MKICIPITFRPQGGGFYFIQALSAFLADKGWRITNNIESRYDVLFTNHWMVLRSQILKAIRYNPRLRIVQRIDGAAQDYGRKDDADRRQHDVNLLADLTIFQSNYCRYSTREKFPIIGHDGPVIYIPVNPELFYPEESRSSLAERVRVACVTWSANPRKGAAFVYDVARRNSDTDFVLCGQYPGAPDLANVCRLGVLDREKLAETLRSCHVLLTFSKNEACPNHVLEGMASGLPILYGESGAMHEIIGGCGLPVTVEIFAEQLGKIMGRWKEFSDRSRLRAIRQFHPQHIFPLYVEAIKKTLHLPTSIPMPSRLWLAWSEPAYRYARRKAGVLRNRINT